ncbi:MAG TPA: hypothetical protein VFD58_36665 [Blastocatellia bacterium]|nr:hypothetical protein [Blastocatellia bacterium]
MRLPIARFALTGLVLLTTGFVASLPARRAGSATQRRDRARPLRCTKEVLAALKPIPKLDYECAEREEDNLKSPERRAALKAWLRELESSFADADWWAAPVEDLNICTITREARAMSDEESRDFRRNDVEVNLYGDQSTRLVIVTDPCIRYSYSTLDACILERAGGRVYATQVLNAWFTRADAAVDMCLARHNGEKLIIVETNTVDGFLPPSPFTTWQAYSIDPRSHRAMPKKIFREHGRPTNRFRWDNYVFEDEGLARRWRAPEIIRDGRLLPQFNVYSLVRHHFVRTTYVWNGEYYATR